MHNLVVVQDPGAPRLRKKKDNPLATRITPPRMITPQVTNKPIPANKFVWVLHPSYENIVVAQGKSGVAWKSKSKAAAELVIGEQLVQIHRVFTKSVPAMCHITGDEF